jgi:hypothetical protein
MLANVVDSDRAIAMSVQVVREFVRVRAMARSRDSFGRKLVRLARAVRTHGIQIDELFAAVEKLIAEVPEPGPAKRIGFAKE